MSGTMSKDELEKDIQKYDSLINNTRIKIQDARARLVTEQNTNTRSIIEEEIGFYLAELYKRIQLKSILIVKINT